MIDGCTVCAVNIKLEPVSLEQRLETDETASQTLSGQSQISRQARFSLIKTLCKVNFGGSLT